MIPGTSRYFSPLFIGESSLTPARRQQPPARWLFQSPLHRGVLFNRIDRPLLDFLKHFSPLFIGESSLTCDNGKDYRALLLFQSPLHRGVLFNADVAAKTDAIRQISVPSSSGSPL